MTTSINQSDVIAHGLIDVVEICKQKEYMCVPNKSYRLVEIIISAAENSKKLNTRQARLNKKSKVVEEEEHKKALNNTIELKKFRH